MTEDDKRPLRAFPTPSDDPAEQEGGRTFRPRFGSDGLVTAVAVDDDSDTILMLAHMDREALAATCATGIAHYYSRSRRQIWKKGATSGQIQTVRALLVDCDQDALILRVRVGGDGGACHTGARSCFYRAVIPDGTLIGVDPDRCCDQTGGEWDDQAE